MFAFDESPAYTTLLLQCGYRSKLCTNPRATKTNGTLHKLCEFHRRKANLNQLKLHKRQREERAKAKQQKKEVSCPRPAKRPRRNSPLTIEPICHTVNEFQIEPAHIHDCQQTCESSLTPDDVLLLEMLLFDVPEQQSAYPSASSPSAVEFVAV